MRLGSRRRLSGALLIPGILLVAFACSTAHYAELPTAHSTQAAPSAAAPAALPPFHAPTTRADDFVDDYHGTPVADPYRWLESQDDPAVRAWVRSQDAAARGFLDALPARQQVRARLTELWNHPRHSAPERFGDRWFTTVHDSLRPQPVLCVGSDPLDCSTVLFDPNQLDSAGTTALAAFQPSHDGALVAIALAQGGSDWREWRVLDVRTGAERQDRLRWSKFAGAAWTHDGQGFFYQRFPAPAPEQALQAQNRNAQLCYHKLGTDQTADQVVYERPDQPDWGFAPKVTDDGRFLVVRVSAGSDRKNRIVFVDLEQEGWPVQPLRMLGDAAYDFVGNDGDTFWFRTDLGAPRGRIVTVARTAPSDAPAMPLVAETRDVLQAAYARADRLVCVYLSDAVHRVVLHDLEGHPLADLPLPALGRIGALTGRRVDAEAFCQFDSMLQPPTILRLDLRGKAAETLRPPVLTVPGDLVGNRVFLQSRDGTRLCLFLLHRRNLVLDGQNPTYLFGYGGFAQAMTPGFSIPNLVWAERGGVYAQAVIRGGGEYGQQWHHQGRLDKKQNVFDDFLACADYLVRNGYCTPERLGIGGRSNGGLLAGALLTQQPQRFGAVVPEVGVLDMLRYHRFTIGRAWIPEYGSSDDPEQFAWLRRYSPLHNVKAGTEYPPTLLMTGDHDDRVVPAHSYKFAAALQAAQAGPGPILLRVEQQAGHGAGMSVQKRIDEAADRLAFLEAVLGPLPQRR